MSAVFHLLTIFVKVVEPDDISTWRTRFSKARSDLLSTRRKACAVRSLVVSFCRFHTPSRETNSCASMRTLGSTRTSKPHMLKSRLGLSLE